jgi:hypothetical protein
LLRSYESPYKGGIIGDKSLEMKIGDGSAFPTNVTIASRVALGPFDGGTEGSSIEVG